jgi:hypothetical protein
VAIGHQQIEAAVQIDVKEEAAEAQGEAAGLADSRLWGFVDKEAMAFVSIELVTTRLGSPELS